MRSRRRLLCPLWMFVSCCLLASLLLVVKETDASSTTHSSSSSSRQLTYDPHNPHVRSYQVYNSNYDTTVRGNSNGSDLDIPKSYYTRLSDVWLCLLVALLWTVWMLNSLVRSDLLRYQKDSVLVHGHVLEVSVEEDSLGTGIPTYKAVIDYMVQPSNAAKSVQVRKHFNTVRLLEEGFANVEILVLPQEPTYSVLREDYQQQVEEQKEDEEEAFIRPTWCKRLSMAFAGLIVLLSLAGCVQVVVRLDPLIRWKGWVSLIVGVTLLLPAGLFVHRTAKALHRLMMWQSEKAGVVIRGAKATMQNLWNDMDGLDPGVCDDEPINAQPDPHLQDSAAPGCYFVQVGGGRGDKSGSQHLPEVLYNDGDHLHDDDDDDDDGTNHSQSTVSSLSAHTSGGLNELRGMLA